MEELADDSSETAGSIRAASHMSSRYHDITQTGKTSCQDLLLNPSIKRGVGHKVLPLVEELLSSDGCWEC